MGRLTLILGGVRSGKSRFAQELAAQLEEETGGLVTFLATAQAGDEEMRERIEKHQRSRPARWKTVEAPLQAAEALQREGTRAGVVLLDCLTVLLSNILLSSGDPVDTGLVDRELDRLVAAVQAVPAAVIVVSNEVGLGVVPPSPLGRLFRDVAGLANQHLAREAEIVYFMVAGLPRKLK